MKFSHKASLLALLSIGSLSGCSAFRSDANSSNPVVAEQARRVNDLEREVKDQDRIVDSEKAKLKSLKYQLKSARAELKARKL
ncbi:hypothetical protein MUN82_09300 [Hymenobacter aerilatus]|uniref:SlyB protein n=1 Tax=Hymenobacter aerilatus TaxID=2932251 RepID=A0A8T9SYX2_9BACT|nr:hypothetical protein [Hymenobacter aerilatus]UOR07278.1 hypothetical protein MUN82_09300 [Hymenobacter aerilatus]